MCVHRGETVMMQTPNTSPIIPAAKHQTVPTATRQHAVLTAAAATIVTITIIAAIIVSIATTVIRVIKNDIDGIS